MTKSEQAALEELHMTPEEIEQRQAKIAQLLNGEEKQQMIEVNGERLPLAELNRKLAGRTFIMDKPTRKPRSDKGIPKGPKKPAESGCISAAQAERLRHLIDTKQSRLAELDAINEQQAHALGAVDAAEAELEAYLLELQGKR